MWFEPKEARHLERKSIELANWAEGRVTEQRGKKRQDQNCRAREIVEVENMARMVTWKGFD